MDHNFAVCPHKSSSNEKATHIEGEGADGMDSMKVREEGNAGSHGSRFGPWLHAFVCRHYGNKRGNSRIMGEKVRNKGHIIKFFQM